MRFLKSIFYIAMIYFLQASDNHSKSNENFYYGTKAEILNDDVSVSTGLEKNVAITVIYANRAQLSHCFTPNVYKKFPNVLVNLTLVLDSSGLVTSSKAESKSPVDVELAKCIESKTIRWRFPKPNKVASVNIKAPINLRKTQTIYKSFDHSKAKSEEDSTHQRVTGKVPTLKDPSAIQVTLKIEKTSVKKGEKLKAKVIITNFGREMLEYRGVHFEPRPYQGHAFLGTGLFRYSIYLAPPMQTVEYEVEDTVDTKPGKQTYKVFIASNPRIYSEPVTLTILPAKTSAY